MVIDDDEYHKVLTIDIRYHFSLRDNPCISIFHSKEKVNLSIVVNWQLFGLNLSGDIHEGCRLYF